MSPNPRVVSADAHDGEIVGRAIIQFRERVGHGGIATVNDASLVARDDVAVVSAMDVVLHSRAPMFWLERTHFDIQTAWSEVHRFFPSQLDHLAEFRSPK